MTASIIQERATDATANGTNITLAFASNNAAGNAIHAIASSGSNPDALTSIQDTNNTYGAILNSITDTTTVESQGQAIAVNIAVGANTVQANFPSSPGFRAICIREIGGVTASPNDGNNGKAQVPGTGADVTSSGAATNLVQPVFMSALSFDENFATAPTKGTGFTLGTSSIWTFGGLVGATTEHRRYTDTVAKGATFTAADATSRTLTHMALFDEFSGIVSTGAYQQENSTTNRYLLEDSSGVYLIEPWGGTGVFLPPFIQGDYSGIGTPGRFFKDRLH